VGVFAWRAMEQHFKQPALPEARQEWALL
jgi:hypothetical protein